MPETYNGDETANRFLVGFGTGGVAPSPDVSWTLNGNGGDDLLGGGHLRDAIDGGAGRDALFGGDGSDVITDRSGDGDTLSGAEGDDFLVSGGSNQRLSGDAGDDEMTFEATASGRSTADGGAGDDVVISAGAAHIFTFDGGAGEDLVDYSNAAAAVTVNLALRIGGGAADGDRYLRVENVEGTRFTDALTGDGAANYLFGGDGDDVLDGGVGADILDGGFSGVDVATYAASRAAVDIDLTTGLGFGGDADGDLLINIDNLAGSRFSDVLTGDSGANIFFGGAGNDHMDGGPQTTAIDTVDYGASAAAVTINLVTGAGNGGDATGDSFVSIERIVGSGLGDRMFGSARADTLDGGDGADALVGGGGNDTLLGDAGLDTLTGGTGVDTIDGGDGADLLTGGVGGDALTGGAGGDALTGGAGGDRFIYTALGDSLDDSDAADFILDFSRAERDKVDLSAIDARTTQAGDQAFVFIGANAFTGVAGQLRYSVFANLTSVGGDVDGDGTADFALVLANLAAPPAAVDFVL